MATELLPLLVQQISIDFHIGCERERKCSSCLACQLTAIITLIQHGVLLKNICIFAIQVYGHLFCAVENLVLKCT